MHTDELPQSSSRLITGLLRNNRRRRRRRRQGQWEATWWEVRDVGWGTRQVRYPTLKSRS
jgi:hypothetical protein